MSGFRMDDFIAVTKNSDKVLGKMIYYSLGNILIEKDKMLEIGAKIGMDIKPRREAKTDAFMSATGDIRDTIRENDQIFKIYIRDNKRVEKGIVSRELVKETLDPTSNTYEKLGNFVFDKENQEIQCEIYSYEYAHYEEKVRNLYDLYQRCYGKVSIETIVENYIHSLDASKISIHGKLFFVPNFSMDRLTLLEDLFFEVEEANLNKEYSTVTFNSMYVTNDEKQSAEMEKEFYTTLNKEIEFCQAQLQRMINEGKESKKIISKWLEKVDRLLEKKARYENLFNKELNKLQDNFEVLEIQRQELEMRIKKGQLSIAV